MATLSRAYQLVIAVVLIAAMIVSVVESSYPPRSGRRRSRPSMSRYPSFPIREGFPRSPSYPHDPAPQLPSTTQVRSAGNWFQNFIASKHANNNPSPNPANPDRSIDHGVDQEKVVVRPPIIKSGSIVTSPAITMIFLETIDVRRRNSSRPQQPTDPETPQEEEEVVTNQATTLPSNPRPSRRAFTADEARIRCGGPNEAGQTEECYRFELPTDLNNNAIVISGAVVLLPAGDSFPASRHHGNTHQRVHHNVTIVAKFPTSGEGAYRESISVQNISYDIPWKWKSASLPSGSSLVSRALQEDNTLLLKLSIITNGNGIPTTTNFIPMESNMLPVLVVDIEFNGTDSSTTSSTTETETLRSTQANVVERQLRKRRTVSRPSDVSEDPLPSNTVTCSGYPGCCRRTMDISFSDLGMHWIVAPLGITTSVCIGSCLAPSMTFQSFVLNLMGGHRPSSREDRTCIPSHTEHAVVLVFNDDGDIQMVEMPDFIVRECACAGKKKKATTTTTTTTRRNHTITSGK